MSTFNLGEACHEGMGTISYEERMKRLKDASEARSREARGEPEQYVPVVSFMGRATCDPYRRVP